MDLKEQYDKLLRYCYMKTKDGFIAEDITQETLLRFWQSHTYKETGKEMAYLYTIAGNLCMDEFRRKRPCSIDDKPELISEKCFVADNIPKTDEPEGVIERVAIESALGKLPEELREIVVMRYICEMSAAEIGKVIGMSRFSVNRRLKEGLEILRESLEGGTVYDR